MCHLTSRTLPSRKQKPSHCQIMTIWLFLIFRIINVFQNQILHFGRRENARLRHLEKMLYRSTGKRIDLRYVSSLLSSEQTTALGYIIKHLESNAIDGKKNLQTLVDTLYQTFDQNGFSSIAPNTNMALPRRQEIFAALNRYRKLNL